MGEVSCPQCGPQVWLVQGEELLDLSYEEDVAASVDMNVVMTGRLHLVEIQGRADGAPHLVEHRQVRQVLPGPLVHVSALIQWASLTRIIHEA